MPITAAPTRRLAKRIIAQLPPRKLHAATEFLKYLEVAEDWDETREILRDRKLVSRLQRARAAWERGDLSQFVRWEPKR